MKSRLTLSLLSLLALAGGCGPSVTREPPLGIAVQDVEGGEHRLFDGREDQPVALVFWMQDCPIANGYAPRSTGWRQSTFPAVSAGSWCRSIESSRRKRPVSMRRSMN